MLIISHLNSPCSILHSQLSTLFSILMPQLSLRYLPYSYIRTSNQPIAILSILFIGTPVNCHIDSSAFCSLLSAFCFTMSNCPTVEHEVSRCRTKLSTNHPPTEIQPRQPAWHMYHQSSYISSPDSRLIRSICHDIAR